MEEELAVDAPHLVTDITSNLLDAIGAAPGDSSVTVSVTGQNIAGLSRAFHDPPGGGLRALIGSHGRLEIAVVDGSAAAMLEAGSGTEVELTIC